MDYTAALKKVRAEKPAENFMVLEFGYDNKIVVAHKDGVTVLAALASAEKLKESYGENPRISDLEREFVKFQHLSVQEYQRIKVATLLGISPNEVKEMMEVAAKHSVTTP